MIYITLRKSKEYNLPFYLAMEEYIARELPAQDYFAIITNTKGDNNGKLIVQSVGSATEYTVIGGEGKEFWLNDSLGNASTDISEVAGSVAEYGWGRIEISPAVAEKTNHMLTVMYVTDADNNKAPVKATDIGTDTLSGALMFGKAMFFPKNDKLIDSEQSFTLSSSADCFITGVKAGTWEICDENGNVKTVTVAEGENILTFSANKGSYTIKIAD